MLGVEYRVGDDGEVNNYMNEKFLVLHWKIQWGMIPLSSHGI